MKAAELYTELTNIAQQRGLDRDAKVQVQMPYPNGVRLLEVTDVRQGGDGELVIDTIPVAAEHEG